MSLGALQRPVGTAPRNGLRPWERVFTPKTLRGKGTIVIARALATTALNNVGAHQAESACETFRRGHARAKQADGTTVSLGVSNEPVAATVDGAAPMLRLTRSEGNG